VCVHWHTSIRGRGLRLRLSCVICMAEPQAHQPVGTDAPHQASLSQAVCKHHAVARAREKHMSPATYKE
jgi:hypothetical protein